MAKSNNLIWDDILIVGDSFCATRDSKDSWPQLVACSLTGNKFNPNAQPRGKGFPGGSWWSYRKVLIDELKIKTPKVLIVCHTDTGRIPNDNDYSLNSVTVEHRLSNSTAKEEANVIPIDVVKAAHLYYTELFSHEFHEWSSFQWFKELDELCKEYNIEKVIHLYCFHGEYTKFTFINGLTIDNPLIDYTEESRPVFLGFKNKVINHFTVKGNKLFAKAIVELVHNYPGNIRKKLIWN